MSGRVGNWMRAFGRTRALIALLALCAYTPGFWWGAPYATAADRANAWAVDDEPPMGPLAQLHDIVHPKAEQNPNLGYPMLHPFMVIGSYAPYVGWLMATNQLSNATAEFPHGFSDPVVALRNLTWISHFLSVLLAVGIVVAAYDIGRVLWTPLAGVWSAAFAGLVFPMFFYARTSNVDVPVLFFTALALIAFSRCLMLGLTTPRVLALATLMGLAMATKEPSFATFAGVPFVLLVLPSPQGGNPAWRSAATWRLALLCFVTSVAAYALASGMVIDPSRWVAHIDFVRGRSGEAAKGGVAFAMHYPMTWEGHRALAARLTGLLADCLTVPGLVLSVVGLIMAAWRTRRAFWFSVTAVTYLGILFWSARIAQLRYVMPAAFTLALFAAFAASTLLHHRARAVRWFTACVVLVALGTAGLRAADLTYAMLHDSRHAAGDWLRANGKPGDRLEYFGSDQKNPPMEAWLVSARAIRYLGGNIQAPRDSATVASILSGWSERQPRFVVLIPDFTSAPGELFAASCPPDIARRLEDGSAGYRRAGRFESADLLPWVHRPLLDYPVVNPPILIYERIDATAAGL
ncbi:MAG: hypothetical protein ABMA00_12070 [Gemmatimonas sp.]